MSLLKNGYSTLFPEGLRADSTNGNNVFCAFQESVQQCYDHFEDLCASNSDAFPSLSEEVDKTFAFLEAMADKFVDKSERSMLFRSKDDASELVLITVLDIKRAILDFAVAYMEESLISQSSNRRSDNDNEDLQQDNSDYIPSSNGKKKRPNLPAYAKDILSSWFSNHVEHPYPTQAEKVELSEKTGLSLQKVDNWFINERSRKWQTYRRK